MGAGRSSPATWRGRPRVVAAGWPAPSRFREGPRIGHCTPPHASSSWPCCSDMALTSPAGLAEEGAPHTSRSPAHARAPSRHLRAVAAAHASRRVPGQARCRPAQRLLTESTRALMESVRTAAITPEPAIKRAAAAPRVRTDLSSTSYSPDLHRLLLAATGWSLPGYLARRTRLNRRVIPSHDLLAGNLANRVRALACPPRVIDKGRSARRLSTIP